MLSLYTGIGVFSSRTATEIALVLEITPFWTSYILRLYAWQTIINTNGLLNTVLVRLGSVETPLQIMFTRSGTRIGLIHYLAPIMILILYLVFRNIDRTLMGASEIWVQQNGKLSGG